jgi:hypothetical protein
MVYYKKSDYNLINIQKSDRKEKKYTAVIQQKPAGKIKYIHFGAIKPDGTPYPQYRDSTKLKLYKKYDHHDKKRKDNYVARMKGHIKPGYYSAGEFAMTFLWR